jgi:hypothetical protein
MSTKKHSKADSDSSAGGTKPIVSGSFLFSVGDMVRYKHRSISGECKILKRKREKDYFLSEVNGCNIYFNVYETEEIMQSGRKLYWDDKEIFLVSANTEIPAGAVDYASDEYSADFLDNNGNILKTVKAGKSGYAHELVRGQLNCR